MPIAQVSDYIDSVAKWITRWRLRQKQLGLNSEFDINSGM